MIRGRFGDTTAAPYVEARLTLPRFKLNTDISFLLDTGATLTVLMPMDGSKIGLDYSKLLNPEMSHGVGGEARNFMEDALVTFADDQLGIATYKIRLMVAEPTTDNASIPSLLGRNIVNRWKLNYHPQALQCEAEVVSADITIPTLVGNRQERRAQGKRR